MFCCFCFSSILFWFFFIKKQWRVSIKIDPRLYLYSYSYWHLCSPIWTHFSTTCPVRESKMINWIFLLTTIHNFSEDWCGIVLWTGTRLSSKFPFITLCAQVTAYIPYFVTSWSKHWIYMNKSVQSKQLASTGERSVKKWAALSRSRSVTIHDTTPAIYNA